MAFKIAVDAEAGYVLVEHYGETSVEESIHAGQEALQSVIDHGLDRILIDVTGITGKTSVLDLFKSTQYHAEHAPPVRPRAALFGRPDQKDDLNFVETVGVNRGMELKAFLDRDAALAWLLK